jgi:uncharacterized protein
MAHFIVIAGGTGFLGQSIINHLKHKPDVKIIVLTRGADKEHNAITYLHWDGISIGKWAGAIENSTAVINLAGKSVNCRYTARNRKEIIASRVNATRAIGKAIQQAKNPPKVWINAGSAAIFGDGKDVVKDELSAPGDGFSADVCKQWEQVFFQHDTPFTRKLLLRMGLVFQKEVGLLQPFTNIVKAGLGGTIGNGKQYISWIHEADFLSILHHALVKEDYNGVIHCVSPMPVTNREFMAALRKELNKSIGLPAPELLTRIGAFLIGTEPGLVLTGRRVVSKVLVEKQFHFQYPGIENALHELIGKKG